MCSSGLRSLNSFYVPVFSRPRGCWWRRWGGRQWSWATVRPTSPAWRRTRSSPVCVTCWRGSGATGCRSNRWVSQGRTSQNGFNFSGVQKLKMNKWILCLYVSLQGKSALWSHLLHYQAREEKLMEQQQQQQQTEISPGMVCKAKQGS